MTALGMAKPRVIVEYGQGETTIKLPVERNLGDILAQAMLVCFWGFGGFLAAALLTAGTGSAMRNVWLVVWAIGMAMLLLKLFWVLAGRERLIARSDGMTRERSILIFTNREHFTAAEARAMRFVADDPAVKVRVNNRRIPQSGMSISRQGRHISLARGISRSDAEDILAAIALRVVRQGRGL